MNIRSPAVAGQFYTDDPSQLHHQITHWFDETLQITAPIRAIIVPHAGYMYSGHTAALAYGFVKQQKDAIHRVLLVGPSHHAYFEGCAVPRCEQFNTPLGNVAIDQHAIEHLKANPLVMASDRYHQTEHCLEVQLPFLQVSLNADVQFIPLLTSHISGHDLAAIIQPLWQDDTLFVISSDLSHFHSYDEANRIDATTCHKIDQCQASLSQQEACGCTAVNALLLLVKKYHYALQRLQRINSGDTSGHKSRVVGYASYIITNT